jgi:hypothetical protein
MKSFDIYVTIVFVVKLIYIILALLLEFRPTQISDYHLISYWKHRVEFIFIALMALLLIYLFNPFTSRIDKIDHESRTLLYLFGFVLLVGAHWKAFFSESASIVEMQQIIGDP